MFFSRFFCFGLFFYGEDFLLSDIKTSFRGVWEGKAEDSGASRGSDLALTFFFTE